MKIHLLPVLLLGCLIGLATTASAHKARVFAYSEGDLILGEAAFSGGRTAKDAEVVVQDNTSGTVLLTTRTDADGAFSFPIPEEARSGRLDLLIVMEAGEGHRGDWLLRAGEYLPDRSEERAAPPALDQDAAAVPVVPAGRQHRVETSSAPACNEAELRRIVSETVAEQLGPVKRMLVEGRRDGPDLRDILGGIGYLVGVAGLIAYVNVKKGASS